jgi:hypothetical protein
MHKAHLNRLMCQAEPGKHLFWKIFGFCRWFDRNNERNTTYNSSLNDADVSTVVLMLRSRGPRDIWIIPWNYDS